MKKMSDRERYDILLKIALGLTLMIGIGIASNIDSLRWLFVDAKDLHQTSGEVLVSKIESGGTLGGWSFNIVYSYEVGELKFASSRVHFGYQAMDDPSYAQSYVDKYPVGRQIVVYYDPSDPENSVLEPQIKWEGLLGFYLMSLLLPISVFGLSAFFFIKNRK